MRIIKNLYHSFVLQLLLLHFKRQPVLLLLWLVLFLSITNVFGTTFGIPYLFLDPEYLGEVSFFSFLIMGLCVGGFIMTYQIVSYILNSYRFPFLATLQYPFHTYFINNSLIPLAFIVTYVILLFQFQLTLEFTSITKIIWNLVAFIAGILGTWLLFITYFTGFNVNIEKLIMRKQKGDDNYGRTQGEKNPHRWEQEVRSSRVWPVKNFISRKFTIRPVRGVEHYDVKLLLAVFRQHHFTAFMIQIITLGMLIALGYLIDYEAFIIPAGASIIILLATLMMFIGAFTFWTRGWRLFAFIILIIVVSTFVKTGWLDFRNEAFGLDYTASPKTYSVDSLRAESNMGAIERDKAHTLEILNNWRKKVGEDKGFVKKPKMVFIGASGGGHRASLWSMTVHQRLDSLFKGAIFDQTMLMTGASGGQIGSAYYRELKLRQQLGETINLQVPKYAGNIAKDLLNPLSFAIVVNDLFYPFKQVEIDSMKYRKDRTFYFEKYLNLNTNGAFDKRLTDYRAPEYRADIPMLLLSPTIINDERFLFISPQPVRYLNRPLNDTVDYYQGGVDGVDFLTFFEDHRSDSLRFVTALRMNATYPYVLPATNLPTNPTMQIMDAGIRDNFGIEPIIRFIHAFSDWIEMNTGGVIVISINSVKNLNLQEEKKQPRNLLSKIFNPIGNLYSNWTEVQGYNHNFLLDHTSQMLETDLEFIEFNYHPGKKERSASMSFHLTTKEKQNIQNAIDQIPNLEALERLKRAFEEE